MLARLLIIAFAATALAQTASLTAIGLSALPLAILMGITYGNVAKPECQGRDAAVLAFCQQKLLRLGIILFGFNLSFQQIAGDVTGHPVAVYQRVDQAGYLHPIDERILADTDTLMVFGLDHLPADLLASNAEIEAIREWLRHEGKCLLLAPHHDVGSTDDVEQRQMEYMHHRDPLVPRQQRFSTYTRSLMKALDVPVHNEFGLRPAVVKGPRDIAPLVTNPDLDELGLLASVTTFSFHPHLPHYRVTRQDDPSIRVLARQPVDLERPHPFTAAGSREFNVLLWMPPLAERAGDILLVDSTHFTTLFGGTDSLASFWRNLARMK